jgi:hypothetical protein
MSASIRAYNVGSAPSIRNSDTSIDGGSITVGDVPHPATKAASSRALFRTVARAGAGAQAGALVELGGERFGE